MADPAEAQAQVDLTTLTSLFGDAGLSWRSVVPPLEPSLV